MIAALYCFVFLSGLFESFQAEEVSILSEGCKQLKTSIRVHQPDNYGKRLEDWANDSHINDPNQAGYYMETEDNGYELRVRRAQDGAMVSGWYEPGRKYTVTLMNRYESVQFRDAIVWLQFGSQHEMGMQEEAEGGSNKRPWVKNLIDRCEHHPTRLGTWEHQSGGRSATQARPGCFGLTAERYGNQRSWTGHLVLTWIAPHIQRITPECQKLATLGCVTIRATVRARGGHHSVFSSNGGLMKTLCSSLHRPPSPVLPDKMTMNMATGMSLSKVKGDDKMKISSMDLMHVDTMQPTDCCACGSATYKLTFQGLWNKQTHPRDWPDHNPGLLHWTNIIGASHMPSYRIFQFGEPSSAGVSAVCMYGDTTVLKQSLRNAAGNTGSISSVPTGTQKGSLGIGPLHSLISTSGMWGEEAIMETRMTYFAVNRTHPLVSFLTMLGPSPNWCAGVSSQSVCQADCTWVDGLVIDLFPWDAGVVKGDTYIPKDSERKDIPDPIRYITHDWMPNNPFTPSQPVARVTLERVLPQSSWECTSEVGSKVELFRSDGSKGTVGSADSQSPNDSPDQGKQAVGDIHGGLPKKHRNKGGGGAGLAGDSPLSDPSLAQMATFLCITDSWSAWNPCSVTCGVGRRTRRRVMVVNKKNELCQHVPLVEEEMCEGRKRTCDFSSPCSLLPWTEWTPCSATCEERDGQQSRRRYLARREEIDSCMHLFKTGDERQSHTVIGLRECGPGESECDPVTICGEGRKDGMECGVKTRRFYYSSVDHACLPFDYLGCKGGRNRFLTKKACEDHCLAVVGSLPAWRRERMALLQYQTSQIANSGNNGVKRDLQPGEHCGTLMDPGHPCQSGESGKSVAWYFSSRTRRCFEFIYLGCGGNKNRYDNYTACISDCLPAEWEKSQQMAKAASKFKSRNVTSDQTDEQTNPSMDRSDVDEDIITNSDLNQINGIWGPKQDCELTEWSGWSPCSESGPEQIGSQMRWRYIMKPGRHGGKPCGPSFETRECRGD